MGLPSKKRTPRSKGDRSQHLGMKKTNVLIDAQGNPYLPHQVNPATGMYKGKQVVNVEKRAARRAKKLKAIS